MHRDATGYASVASSAGSSPGQSVIHARDGAGQASAIRVIFAAGNTISVEVEPNRVYEP